MGGIFFSQGLYRQLLVYEQLASKYAWMGNDTMAALISKEQESFAYNGLGYVDSSIAVVDYVSEKFLIYGYPSDAAISMGMNIRHLIAKGDYRKAKRYMDTYESMSGYFDNQGNIEPGREVYYNLKGLYYYYTNKLDSAEYWFRKELHDGRDFDNQNSAATGLALLYKNTHNSDSSTKYALYAYEMLDSIYVQRTTKEVERMQAMYDYTRHQEIAKREKEKVSIEEKKNLLSMAMLLLVISVAAFIIYKMHSFEIDLAYLANAYNLVNSVSTFAEGAIKINDNLKNLWEYDILRNSEKVIYLQHDFYDFPRKYTIYKMIPSNHYRSEMFSWKIKPSQLQLMISEKCKNKFIKIKPNI
jgi:hypothetical protein